MAWMEQAVLLFIPATSDSMISTDYKRPTAATRSADLATLTVMKQVDWLRRPSEPE